MSTSDDGEVLEVGGRLTEPPADILVKTAFAADLAAQRALGHGIGLADLAHTIGLYESGVIPEAAARELLSALLALQAGPGELTPDPTRGDQVTNREAWIAQRTDAAGWIGCGRARREATTIAYHVVVRSQLLELTAAVVAVSSAVVRRAAETLDVVVADYTYLQAAQPTRFGHYLLTTACALQRDLDRLRAAFERVDRCPAGCGSANGSSLPQDRRRLAELLGFSEPVNHARDAMWQADGPIEAVAVAVSIAVQLDRLAEDLMVLASREFGVVQLSDAHARASKIMPQKRNPYALSYVRAVCNRATGALMAVAAAGRTPSGQMDSRLVCYDVVPTTLREVTGAAALMAAVVAGLAVDRDRARSTVADGAVLATDLAEMLVREAGVDFRSAHRLVARLVRGLESENRHLADVTSADVEAAAQQVLGHTLPAVDWGAALDAESALERRLGLGSAARARTTDMIAQCGEALKVAEAWQSAASGRLGDAERRLLAEAAQIVGGA